MPVSQNGWPASATRKDIGVKNYLVPGAHAHFAVATAAAPLLMAFASYFNEHIEPISGITFDDWGWAYRHVRGSEQALSNHASGSAIDINSLAHPLGARGTFTPDQQVKIRLECKRLGLKWGGDFARCDEMHFEVALSVQSAYKLIQQLDLPILKEKKQ